MDKGERIYKSSGNVFEDLGLPHPAKLMARAQIMLHITGILKERGLTQKRAAALLGLPQSKISCLINGKLSMFSLDHLFELLNTLGYRVEISIKPKVKNGKAAVTRVLPAARG